MSTPVSTPVSKKIPTKDLSREDIFALLEEQLSSLSSSGRSNPERREGMRLLLDWLEGAQGTSWQQRWEALGEATEDWRTEAGATSKRQFYGITHALQTLMCHRIVRPSYAWMNRQTFHQLSNQLRKTTDREDLGRLLVAAKEAGANGGTVPMALSLLTKVLIHTGKRVPQLTTDDLLEYRAVATVNGNYTNGLHTAHLLLRQAGIIDDPPMTIGSAFRLGQYTVEEMVERYGVQCQPIKALFIRYLKERQPALARIIHEGS